MQVGRIEYAPNYGRYPTGIPDVTARQHVEHFPEDLATTTFGPLHLYGVHEAVSEKHIQTSDSLRADSAGVETSLRAENDNLGEETDFERFGKAFRYEPEIGKIVRLDGPDAGVVTTRYPNGYIRVNFDGRGYLGHRVAWLLTTGQWPENEVDHDNLIKDDNRWVNLREADRSSNMGNRPAYKNNKSGLKGAYFNKNTGRWQAFIQKDKKHRYLGVFDTAEAAHAAYIEAANDSFGQFARAS